MAERAHPDDPGFKDKLFGLKKNPYRNALKKRYEYCNKYIQGKDVLDIPCGTGWGTSMLYGFRKIIGIDISEEAINFAKERFSGEVFDFIVGSMDNIGLNDNSIDVIICLEGFEHVEKEVGIRFIKEARRVLRNNGLIILTSPVLRNDGSGSGNPYHLCEYPEIELIELLSANFKVERIDKIEGPDLPIVYFVGRVAK